MKCAEHTSLYIAPPKLSTFHFCPHPLTNFLNEPLLPLYDAMNYLYSVLNCVLAFVFGLCLKKVLYSFLICCCILDPLMCTAKLPFGIDIHHGVGTACEGWIKIPRPGGVRKGWQRAYAIVCDFKVFLHEPSNDIHAPAVAASHVFDIR